MGVTGPNAPFSISYLALRWESGAVRCTVDQGARALVAYADLKYEGTGVLQGQWLVDDVPLRSFSRQLTFGNRVTLNSGRDMTGGLPLSLPTNIPGEHRVTLRVLQPTLTFEVPIIRYFVSLGPDPDGPVIRSVLPRSVRAGEETELQLSGERLKSNMELHLGRDMGVVGPIRMLGPDHALVRVFVAPTARSGARILRSSVEKGGILRSSVEKGGPAGSARIEILPPLKRRLNRK